MVINKDGKITISTGPLKTQKDDLNKWLGRNSDAILVKLIGPRDPSGVCSVGHLCRIEKVDDSTYIAFVGSHSIGQLPDEAVSFAESVDSSPEYLISIVGKVEDDDVFIYIAE
jgi:hypothetical protein